METATIKAMRDYVGHIVEDCDLDSASVFLCDRSARVPSLTYFCHIGVSDEVAQIYMENNIFHDDPFTDPGLHEGPGHGSEGGIIAQEDRRIQSRVVQCGRYAGFMRKYDFAAVGASTRRLAPGIYSVVGLHRFSTRAQGGRQPISMAQLNEAVAPVQDMVAGQVLRRIAGNAKGIEMLRMACFSGDPPLAALSPREAEVAALIAQGHQNKVIAHMIHLSENTVENHLRRIYAKLGIHNRAALAAMMAGQDPA